jgi:hypothetical protein
MRGDSVMDRRTFIGSVAGGLLAVPFAAEAQQSTAMRTTSLVKPPPLSTATQGRLARIDPGTPIAFGERQSPFAKPRRYAP